MFALYVRLLDQTDANYDQRHTQKLIRGVRNNYSERLPDPSLPANEKRKVLRHFGWKAARGAFLEDVGLVGVPEQAGQHIELSAVKLLAALHYRHIGVPLGERHGVCVGWSQIGLPGIDEAREVLFSGMPKLVIGARVNTSIGDQFAYRWGVNSDEGLFGYGAEFGSGLFVFAASAPWSLVSELEDWARYAPPRSP